MCSWGLSEIAFMDQYLVQSQYFLFVSGLFPLKVILVNDLAIGVRQAPGLFRGHSERSLLAVW